MANPRLSKSAQFGFLTDDYLNGCCSIVGSEGRTRRTVIGKPSDWNCNWYRLPLLSIAVHEMLEIWRIFGCPDQGQRVMFFFIG